MDIYSVKINGYTNPCGYDLSDLRISWKVKNTSGKKQKFVKIEISTNKDFSNIEFEKSGSDLNSCGESIDFPLKPLTRYFVRVTVVADNDDVGICDKSFFETGKMSDPWVGKWIGVSKNDLSDHKFHPEFKKEFRAKTDKDIESARLYICGLGSFVAYINGMRVGNDHLAPFINDYESGYQYMTYDITNLLSAQTSDIPSNNVLNVFLGNAWYRGKFGLSCKSHYERPFALIAEIHINYGDGTKDIIATDNTFFYKRSPFTLTDIYDGETQDYTLYGNPDNKFEKNAELIDCNYNLLERYSIPLCSMEKLAVKEIIKSPRNELILDFGQNFAGYVEFNLPLEKNQTVELEFCEILQNGSFYNENYRTAASTFTYISDGVNRSVHTYFSYFGFRYVRVTGVKNISSDAFIGHVIYSEMDRIGFLVTGSKKINKLYENSLWGLKSNFTDIPTDCPQRDERLGWCGDTQVFCKTASYHMDTRAFYQKFMRDLKYDQNRNNGKVAIYLPNEFPGLVAGVWSDISTIIPTALFDFFGDRNALEENYALMKNWVDYVHSEDSARGEKNLYDFGFQFGDWLALDGPTDQSRFGRTDKYFVSSAYYYQSAKAVAKAAKNLGYTDDFRKYCDLSHNIKKAIINEYFTPTGRLSVDTQTGYILCLAFGIYTNKERIVNDLKLRIKNDCKKIKGGFVGATMMNTVLSDNGLSDIAYDFLTDENYPGWLYQVNLGATTIWERWNSVLPDGKISGTQMNSLNHYSYGSVVEFLYKNAAGLASDTPGFKHAVIAPRPDIRLRYLELKYDSASGVYSSSWKINDDGSVSYNIEIPFNCTADVFLEGEDDSKHLDSGFYSFTIKTDKKYNLLYTSSTPLTRLLKDERVVEILDELIPGLSSTDTSDTEAMSKSLEDEKTKALLFRAPVDHIDKAISMITKLK